MRQEILSWRTRQQAFDGFGSRAIDLLRPLIRWFLQDRGDFSGPRDWPANGNRTLPVGAIDDLHDQGVLTGFQGKRHPFLCWRGTAIDIVFQKNPSVEPALNRVVATKGKSQRNRLFLE